VPVAYPKNRALNGHTKRYFFLAVFTIYFENNNNKKTRFFGFFYTANASVIFGDCYFVHPNNLIKDCNR